MAKIRAMIGTGGGQPTETVLWTNPNTSAEFGANDVTLSDSITNYDLIKIVYKFTTTSSDTTENTSASITPTDLVFCSTESTGNKPKFSIAARSGGGTIGVRIVSYVSDTSIRIDRGRRIGSTSYADGNAIPIKIIGIKGGGITVNSH